MGSLYQRRLDLVDEVLREWPADPRELGQDVGEGRPFAVLKSNCPQRFSAAP
jgi:hypothetical protein